MKAAFVRFVTVFVALGILLVLRSVAHASTGAPVVVDSGVYAGIRWQCEADGVAYWDSDAPSQAAYDEISDRCDEAVSPNMGISASDPLTLSTPYSDVNRLPYRVLLPMVIGGRADVLPVPVPAHTITDTMKTVKLCLKGEDLTNPICSPVLQLRSAYTLAVGTMPTISTYSRNYGASQGISLWLDSIPAASLGITGVLTTHECSLAYAFSPYSTGRKEDKTVSNEFYTLCGHVQQATRQKIDALPMERYGIPVTGAHPIRAMLGTLGLSILEDGGITALNPSDVAYLPRATMHKLYSGVAVELQVWASDMGYGGALRAEGWVFDLAPVQPGTLQPEHITAMIYGDGFAARCERDSDGIVSAYADENPGKWRDTGEDVLNWVDRLICKNQH